MVNMFELPFGGGRITVNKAHRSDLLEEVRERLRHNEGFAIATLNLDHMVKLRRSPEFRAAYLRQDFVVADGNPIVWLSRLARNPVSLVAGSDLVEPLAALAAEEGAPVALLGATDATLERAAAELTRRYPGLRIAARLAPGRNFDPCGPEADAMILALRRSGARLTFLALGAPKQEVFAARCRDLLPGIGLASVGAGLDFVAASQRRAPAWVRRIAMEWAWRMLREPRRLAARYALCAAAFPRLVLNVLADAWTVPPAATAATLRGAPTTPAE